MEYVYNLPISDRILGSKLDKLFLEVNFIELGILA